MSDAATRLIVSAFRQQSQSGTFPASREELLSEIRRALEVLTIEENVSAPPPTELLHWIGQLIGAAAILAAYHGLDFEDCIGFRYGGIAGGIRFDHGRDE